eukprot:g9215.t1
MYSGMAKDSAEWFEQQGFPIPAHINVADYLLDLANGDIEGNEMDGESSRLYLIDCMVEKLEDESSGSVKNNLEEVKNTTKDHPRLDLNRKALLAATSKSVVWGATYFEQVSILISRATKNRRFSSFASNAFFRTIGLTVFTCICWWQVGNKNTLLAASEVSSIVFFLLGRMQFDLLVSTVATVPTTLKHLKKERASGMYRLSAFYISESISTLPLDYSLPMIHVVVSYWCAHLHQSFISFFIFVCTSILAGLAAQAVGVFIGIMAKNPKNGSSASAVYMFGMLLLAGYFARSIPSSLSWLQYFSVTYWSYRVAIQTQFHDIRYVDCGGISDNQLPLDQCTSVEYLGKELGLPIDVNGAKWPSILTLFGMILILKVITYYILNARTLT